MRQSIKHLQPDYSGSPNISLWVVPRTGSSGSQWLFPGSVPRNEDSRHSCRFALRRFEDTKDLFLFFEWIQWTWAPPWTSMMNSVQNMRRREKITSECLFDVTKIKIQFQVFHQLNVNRNRLIKSNTKIFVQSVNPERWRSLEASVVLILKTAWV